MQNPHAKIVAQQLANAACLRALYNNVFYTPELAKSGARHAIRQARIWREMGEREAKRNGL